MHLTYIVDLCFSFQFRISLINQLASPMVIDTCLIARDRVVENSHIMAEVVSTSRINLTLPIFPNPSMSDWYVSFEEILDEHKEEFLEANNPQSMRCRQVLRNVRDAIVDAHKSQNDPVDLPKALKMVMTFA